VSFPGCTTPVQAEKLYAEIERVLPVSIETKCQVDGLDSTERREKAFDPVAALARASGDEGLLKEISAMFLDDCPRLISKIKNAITCGDSEALGFAAHTLKGVVGNFHAQAASEAAERLEMMADKGELRGLDVALANLEKEIERLSGALSLYHEGQTACAS
jgi:HPt (histidine-containing phosphotransfer) domain-containing protein